MIRHSVVFRLRHPAGSAAETAFFGAVSVLTTIPGVENFQVLREVSPKNDYSFGLAMNFADQATFDGYTVHADHVAFVENVWLPQVADFLEIDTVER